MIRIEKILLKRPKLDNKNKLKKSMKNDNSSGTNGMHNPSSVTAIPLTSEHYMVIGNSRSKISDTNPKDRKSVV